MYAELDYRILKPLTLPALGKLYRFYLRMSLFSVETGLFIFLGSRLKHVQKGDLYAANKKRDHYP